jgi:hypothetical protein
VEQLIVLLYYGVNLNTKCFIVIAKMQSRFDISLKVQNLHPHLVFASKELIMVILCKDVKKKEKVLW